MFKNYYEGIAECWLLFKKYLYFMQCNDEKMQQLQDEANEIFVKYNNDLVRKFIIAITDELKQIHETDNIKSIKA